MTESLFKEISKAGSFSAVNRDQLLSGLSEKYLVGKSSVLSASSFYDFLKEEHYRKKVFICDGTACLTSGKQKKVKKALLGKFREEEIGTVSCLGHCHSGNAFMIDHNICSLMTLIIPDN